jgi:large subunit ribosomal protein L35
LKTVEQPSGCFGGLERQDKARHYRFSTKIVREPKKSKRFLIVISKKNHRFAPSKKDLLNRKKMPKVKPNSGAKKRFRLTGTGKIKRKHAFKRHILTKKSTKQKRRLTHDTLVFKGDVPNVKALLKI